MLNKTYEQLKEVVIEMEEDNNKFWNGTNSAGARTRKRLQTVKQLAQSLRTEIQDEKNKNKK